MHLKQLVASWRQKKYALKTGAPLPAVPASPDGSTPSKAGPSVSPEFEIDREAEQAALAFLTGSEKTSASSQNEPATTKPWLQLRRFGHADGRDINWPSVLPLLLLSILLLVAVGYQIKGRPEQEPALLATMKHQYENGQYLQAMQTANRGISLYPDGPYFHFFKSRLLEKEHLKNEALVEIVLACHAQPNDLELIAYRAQLRAECGHLRDALSDFEQLTHNQEWKAKTAVIVGQINVELMTGSIGKALDDADTAIRVHPHEPLLFAARAAIRTKLQHYQQALEDWNKVIALTPNDAHAYAQRALVEYQTKQMDKADNDLAKSLKIAPNATAYLNRGIISKDQRKYAAAITDFSSALRFEPDNAVAVEALGQCCGARGDYEKGLAQFDQALSSVGAKDTPYYYQGSAALAMAAGNYKKALSDFSKATWTPIDQQRIRISRAYCYEELGELGSAYREYSLLLDSNPRQYDLHLKRGVIAVKQHRYSLAAADFETATFLMPMEFEAYFLLGEALAKDKSYVRAVASYNHALQLKPKNNLVRMKIAELSKLIRLAKASSEKASEEAIAEQAMLNEIATSDLATLKRKGYGALQAGNVEYAVPALTRAIRLSPNDPLLREYMAHALVSAGEDDAAVEQLSAWEKLSKVDLIGKLSFVQRLQHPGSNAAAKLFKDLIRQYRGDAQSLLSIAVASEAQGFDQEAESAVKAGLRVANDSERTPLIVLQTALKNKEFAHLSRFTPEEQEQLKKYVRPGS
jgi:tetratricopeptide (TPR) repeat protein